MTQTIPDRRWVATVKLPDGGKLTTTIYGPNPTVAEELYMQVNPGTVAIVRLEGR